MGELAALFAASFVAATLFPLPSEAALFAYLQLHPESKALAVSVATVGNTAGGMTSYLMGRVIPQKGAEARENRGAPWRAGPSCSPGCRMVGDALCVAAGWLRVNWALALGVHGGGTACALPRGGGFS